MKLILFAFSLAVFSLGAQDNPAYEYANYIEGQDTMQYRILKPLNFQKSKKYPVVLFMHGAGERGSDNRSQLKHGSNLFSSTMNREKFEAFVIFPQCPNKSYWANIDYSFKPNGLGFSFKEHAEPMKSLALVMNLMDDFSKNEYVDTDRIYVMGLSMGGMATFELLYRQQNFYAAAIPICGGANEATAQKYAASTPVWIIHGADDKTVNPVYSLKMAQAIIDAGGSVRLSIYDNISHMSWNRAFEEPDFLSWLFSKSR